jgi:membrane protease YdiL (CAAX protease family)
MRAAPLVVSTAIAFTWAAFATVAYRLILSVDPSATPVTGGLWIIIVIAAIVAAGLTALGWWRAVGFNRPAEWRERQWLILPLALTLLPLVAGIRAPEISAWLLVAGYALTGFAEEGVFRGVILRLLNDRPRAQAAATAAILFGLAHIGNIFIRDNAAVVMAQAVGAACFGFGYAAVRFRTGTLVPLIVAHMLTDLFLQIGKLPLIPVAVVQDVILLAYGLWLLRPGQRA